MRTPSLDGLLRPGFSLAATAATVASVALLALGFFAEAAGFGIICSAPGDLETLALVYASMAALIVLARILHRRSFILGADLMLLAALSGYFLWRFPIASYSSLIVVVSLVLPPALYLARPWNLILSGGNVAATFILRFLLFPPEDFLRRESALMDLAAWLFYGLIVALTISLRADPERRLSEARESLAEAARINLGHRDWGIASDERFRSEERKRLARDIHDTVGYALTNTIMTLEAARLMACREPEKMEEFIGKARDFAEGALSQVRKDLADLRDRAEDIRAVERSVEIFRITTGMDIRLDKGDAQPRLGSRAAKALRHFVQEAMLNAFRHGRARRVELCMRSSGGALTVTATDDGRGARKLVEGIGLSGMRERAEALGGGIEYRSLPVGFTISMRLPEEEA